jgi:hypothetical protein
MKMMVQFQKGADIIWIYEDHIVYFEAALYHGDQGEEIMKTTIWLTNGMYQVVDEHPDKVAARLLAY